MTPAIQRVILLRGVLSQRLFEAVFTSAVCSGTRIAIVVL